jgi:hypothetical protein
MYGTQRQWYARYFKIHNYQEQEKYDSPPGTEEIQSDLEENDFT